MPNLAKDTPDSSNNTTTGRNPKLIPGPAFVLAACII